MNPIVFANIALKVVAVYVITQGIMQLPNIVILLQWHESPTNNNDQILSASAIVAAILSPLIIGTVLWLISGKLSNFIIKGLEHSESDSITVSHIQAVAISTIGLILLVLALPELISSITQLFGNMEIINNEKVFDINILSYFIASVIKVILGFSLVVGVSGWAKLLNNIRRLGLK